MKITRRITAAALTAVMGAGLLLTPAMARASEEGRRNTALGLGAVAAALLLTQRNKLPGIIAGVGAAAAYKRYDDSIRDRHRYERYGYYDYRDDRNRRNDRYDRNNRDSRYNDRYDDRYDRNDRNRNNDRNDRYYHRTNRNDHYDGDDCRR